MSPQFGENYHPGVDANWPRKRWYMFLKKKQSRIAGGAAPVSLLGIPGFAHGVELPSKIRVGSGSVKPSLDVKLRWMVPVTFDTCRVWHYTIGRRPETIFGRMYKMLWYLLWHKPNPLIRINEWEDLVTFQRDRLRYDLPQKLRTLDTAVIYFRRQLAMRSRDFQRLGGAYGSNHPPTHALAEEKEPVVAAGGDA